ncbi:MAG: hypothetical protein ACE5K0_01815 [Candidatus Methanofastidiosia archaeon]
MEEFEKELKEVGIKPLWIGIPGKSLKSQNHKIFEKALAKIRELL